MTARRDRNRSDDRSDDRSAAGQSSRSLRHVRAAQLRARVARGGIAQVLLGTVFLVGAIANARAPDRHEGASVLWMTGLLGLSTIYVALGTRTLARLRLRRRSARVWLAAAAAWAILSTVMVGFLLRG